MEGRKAARQWGSGIQIRNYINNIFLFFAIRLINYFLDIENHHINHIDSEKNHFVPLKIISFTENNYIMVFIFQIYIFNCSHHKILLTKAFDIYWYYPNSQSVSWTSPCKPELYVPKKEHFILCDYHYLSLNICVGY